MWFFDEGRFGLKPCTGRQWCRRGSTPVATVKQGYQNFYVHAAVNPRTGEDFALELPEVNTQMMNVYLAEFRKAHPERQVILVLDRAGWHKAKALELPQGIELFHLPAYSPELNPVEHLWEWLRRHVCRNRFYQTLEELGEALSKRWRRLTAAFFRSLCRCSYL